MASKPFTTLKVCLLSNFVLLSRRRKEKETQAQPNPQGCDQGVLHQVEGHVLLALLLDPGDSTGRVPCPDPQNVSQVRTGIYIMQNTMVRGGGMVSSGKNKNQEIRGKNEEGERKKEENYIKKGEKGLKKCIFLGYKLKK